LFAGATPRYVRLRNEGPAKAGKAGLHAVPRRWSFDPDELAAAFTSRTRAIVLNSPNNPTGKVFTREELETIAALCRRWDVIAFTDEIYEHLIYDGRRHVPLAAIDGMAERTVTIGSMSKTFSVTGWRVGWAIGPDKMSRAIRKVHDYLTVAAPTPLQEAAVAAFELPESYFTGLAAEYQRRRDLLTEILERHGFSCTPAEGAYYLMARIDAFGTDSDVAFARMLTSEIRVAAIPGSSFYSSASDVPAQLRFCFCKKQETIREADGRLSALGARRVPSRPSAR
jgi:aminotransferase